MAARRKFPRHRPLAALASKARGAAAPSDAARVPGAGEPNEADARAKPSGAPSFAQVAAATGVVPLVRGGRRVLAPKRAVGPRAAARSEFTVVADEHWLEGARPGLAPGVLARLRGAPRATLDLHGSRVAVAERRLVTFLAAEAAAGAHLALVIVGQGRHSPGGTGVLRAAIGEWLTRGAAAAHVLAFRTAPTELGGNGGVLVLLKRR